MSVNQSEVFISYAWGGESEKIVDELEASIQNKGLAFIRDKRDVGFKGLITGFMKRIGMGKAVVIVISDDYLRSPYCMFELMQIYRNHDFAERIFPVVLEDAAIFHAEGKSGYFEYWQKQKAKLEKTLKKLGLKAITVIGEDYKNYDKIVNNFGEVINELKDIYALSPQKHKESNFQQIHQALLKRLKEDFTSTQQEDSQTQSKQATTGIHNKGGKVGQQNIGSNVYNNNVYHSYGKKKIKKFLGVLPFFSETFLGREDDLEAVHQKLFEGNNLLLLVNGEGGIGKTTLAAHYYLNYHHQYQHLAWVFAGNSLADSLMTLAIPLDIRFPDTMPGEERLHELLDALRNLKQPCLLIIDNANELKDLEDHYMALRSWVNFHLLITTRITEFGEATTHKIKPLQKVAAFELFKKHYPAHLRAEDGLLENILVDVGYNTLVIELLAKNLRNLNRLKMRYNLADLLNDLKKKGLLSLSLTGPVSTAYHAPGNALWKENPQLIIEAMYDLSDLTEKESALLSVFAVLPAESIAFQTLETLIPGTGALEETLITLAQKGWSDYNDTERSFKVSPVIQEITKKKNLQLLDDCKELLSSLIEKLDYEGGTGHFINASYQEAALYARYAETVINSFEQADNDIAILCERAGNYHKTTGTLDKALRFYEDYNRLKKELYEADPKNVDFKNGLAISYEKLGTTQTSLGNLDKALAFYEDYNRLEKELCEAYPQNVEFKNNLAISYNYLGNVQVSLSNLNKALQFYVDYNRLEKELYQAYPQNVKFKNNLAISYQKLGSTQASFGNLNKALQFYEDYNRLEKELYQAYPENVEFKNLLAISYQYLGNTQISLGNLDKASQFYENYNRLENELYEAYPQNVSFKNGLAISYSKLGDTQAALGNLDQALTFYEECNRLEKELYEAYPQNVSFKNGLAISYSKLGDTQAALGNLDQALTFYEEYNRLEKELYEAYPQNVKFKNGLAISYSKLGQTQASLGNLHNALQFYEEYNRLEKELYEAYPKNVGFKNGLALSYQWLGWGNEKNQNKDKAKNYYLLSLELLMELVNKFPAYPEFKKNLEWVKKRLSED